MSKMISLLMIVLLLFGGATLAQDTPVFCGDLAEADCALLTESQTAMAALDSGNAKFDMNFLIEGVPEMDGPISFGLNGSVTYTGGDAARELSASMTPEDFSMEDMGELFSVLADALAAIDLDLKLQLVLPSELLAEIGEQFPNPFNLEAKFVDGIGYLNMDTLQALVAEMELSGWYGLDVSGLLRLLGPQMSAMMESMGGMGGMGTMGMNPELLEMAQDPSRLDDFGTITRTDDGSSDEATFEITIDLAAVYADPAMAQLLRDQMAAQMEANGQEMSDEEIDAALSMVTTMFEDMDIRVVETIGVTDKYVHSVVVTFEMDMASMMAAMGESGAAPKILFDMTITQDQFNSVAPITAPEGAQVIPLESIGEAFGNQLPNQ